MNTINILNSNLDIYFLEGIDDGNIIDPMHTISITDANNDKVFCKIKNSVDETISLDISKLSFVLYYNDRLLTENIDYSFAYVTDDHDNKLINVIYADNNFSGWTQYTIKCFINYEATLFSNVLTNDVSEFTQTSSVIYEVPISQPFYKSDSKVIYIEDSLYNINNDQHKYTHVSKILTNTGYNLFGIKRKNYFIENIFHLDDDDINELHNINGEVVKLNPNTTQVQIYSFKNGPQYMELSNDTFLQGITNNGKILPHYIHSYEYKIDGKIPQDRTNDFNIKFYGSTAKFSSANNSAHLEGIENIFSKLYSTITVEEEIDMLNGFNSYSFTVPYVFSENSQTDVISYNKIRNSEEIVKRDKAIDIFENTYMPLNDFYGDISDYLLRSYSDVIEVYERNENYIKLNKSLYSESDIINNIGKYYKYNQNTFSYVPIQSDERIDEIDVFTKTITYTKISSNINTAINARNTLYDNTNVVKYVQLYEYSQIEKTEKDKKSLFYIPKEIGSGKYAYYPIQNAILNDSSVEYYGYTYIKLSEEQIKKLKSKSASECPNIYVKQPYRQILQNDLVQLSENDLKNNLYICDNEIIYNELLSNSDTIFDFDINSKQVYATKKTIDGIEQIVPLDRDELENIYYNTSDWFTQSKQKITSLNKLNNYGLPSAFNIVAKVYYEGKFEKIDFSKLSNPNVELNDYANAGKLFVKQNSYNKINNFELVSGYDADFYIYGIGKIDSYGINGIEDIYIDATKYVPSNTVVNNYFIHPYYIINGDIIYYDEEKWLAQIDKNGFIQNLDYYTRTPIKTLTDDLYLINKKEYYAKVIQETGNTFSGNTPLIPIAYLGIKDGDTIYSLMNYWKCLLNESPLYTSYVKLRNDTSKLFFDSHCANLSYSLQNSETKYPVIYIGFEDSVIDNNASYYISIDLYSGNNYLDINEILQQNDYELCINLSQYETGYTFDWNNINYYKDAISHYLLSSSYNLVTDVQEYDKKYLYSKYFYPQFTNNNGIHQAKDGSYYTTISIFDGTRGTIQKSLFLQPNVFNVTEYTYNYIAYAYVEVDLDENLSNIPQSEYSNYYYIDSDTDSFVQLTSEDKSPSYYQSYLAVFNDSRLYVYMTKEMTAKYDGRNVGTLNNMQVQYFDNVTYSPKIIKKDDNLFGIIFNIDLTNANQNILDPNTNLFVSPINNSDRPYEYDIVKLKEYITNESRISDDTVILQSQKTEYKNITIPTPFYLANEKQATFTGSYIWNLPKHSYIFTKTNNEYSTYNIIKEDGYWEREYEISSVPLVVASYTFYSDPSKISNTTISYTFTPDSTIVTEVIEHPEISYKSIVKESHEVARFKYIYEGIEHDYPSTSKVQENADGSYYGLIEVDGRKILINLVKYIDVDFVNTLKDIVHQEYSVSYKYSSYKNSVALTNEKVPVLYNTELVPATSHKILYWNEDASSYAIKTVIDSYAHYAYNYYYDVVPFITTSYMRQDSEFNISYLSDIHNVLNTMYNRIYDSMSSMSENLSNIHPVINELKDTLNNIGGETNIKLGYLESLSNNITNAISSFNSYIRVNNNELSATSIDFSEITNSIDNQTSYVTESINTIEPKLFEINNTINNSLNSMKEDIVSTLSNIFEYESESITYILKEGLKKKGIPTYEEFMIELTKNMYAKIDFDKEIIDTEQKDENGNMVNRSKHKPNPTDLAKKTIYRADILWQELKKKNIVS